MKIKYTPEQLSVITDYKGRSMVVACPGSGKTTTIIAKVNYMVQRAGVDPSEILVITFTKGAASEMSERYERNNGIPGVTFGTIHSICYQILREVSEDIKFIQEDQKRNYFGKVLNFVSPEKKDYVVGRVISEISRAKNTETQDLLDNVIIRGEIIDLKKIYNDYEMYKHNSNIIDFDDMIYLTSLLLKNRREVLRKWQDRYHYIIIDEFQDTNTLQAEIFYRLSAKWQNLCVVGDDDQSIYSFRGADPSIMLGFSKKFSGVKKFSLSTNYRSPKNFVRKAGRLIKHNKNRFHKKFEAGSDQTGAFEIKTYDSIIDETEALIKSIKTAYKKGTEYADTAILYRNSADGEYVALRLQEEGIPYNIKKQLGIHNNIIYTAFLAYYYLSESFRKNGFLEIGDESEQLFLMTILNTPGRHLSEKMFRNCDLSDKSIEECLAGVKSRETMQKYQYQKSQILALRDTISQDLSKPSNLVSIFRRREFDSWLAKYASHTGHSTEYLKIIRDKLVDECLSYRDVGEWINSIHDDEQQSDGVNLITFHSSKGLEWDNVYILAGNVREDVVNNNLDEERRLFYVAATRARKTLRIFRTKDCDNVFIDEMKG